MFDHLSGCVQPAKTSVGWGVLGRERQTRKTFDADIHSVAQPSTSQIQGLISLINFLGLSDSSQWESFTQSLSHILKTSKSPFLALPLPP